MDGGCHVAFMHIEYCLHSFYMSRELLLSYGRVLVSFVVKNSSGQILEERKRKDVSPPCNSFSVGEIVP